MRPLLALVLLLQAFHIDLAHATERYLELVVTEFVLLGEELVLGEKLEDLHVGRAWLEHDIAFEVQDLLKLFQRQVDHQADAAGK